MAENIIEIRSNINSSFGVIERLRIEREEREKKERDEKWRREQEEREKKIAEWAEKHPNMNKHTYATYYNYDTFNFDYGPSCSLYFYEWSDINREPLKFERLYRFYDFLDKCGLILPSDKDTVIRGLITFYISCKPGSKELLICKEYDELKRLMHEAENLAKVLESVPDVKNEKEVKVLSYAYFPPKQITYA